MSLRLFSSICYIISSMKILAIDTSCDETSVAVVESDHILANKLSSQISSHKEWGGVVPSLAKRKHEELIDLVINKALKQAKVSLDDIDIFAVTKGPGLAIALEVGIRKAKELSLKYKRPLIAINHMEGHIYSTLSKNSKGRPQTDYKFPLLALLVSGGHTEFVLMKDHGSYEIIGQTLDDAIGECFDKVGRMLDLGYPAGPVVEKLAENGDENTYILPVPMLYSKDLNMSYSGLKTAAMKLVNEEINSPLNIYAEKFNSAIQNAKFKSQKAKNQNIQKLNQKQVIADICASFQKAAVEQVILKTDLAIKRINAIYGYKIDDLIIGGGVAQNKYLKKRFKKQFGTGLRIHYPTGKKLYTDNAGMIGVAAYHNALNKRYVNNIETLDREPNWRIDKI
jgi:N6-L-threonylcarbamoyladenine synthase